MSRLILPFLAFTKVLDPDLCNERLSNLKMRRMGLTDKPEQKRKEQPQLLSIDPNKIREYFLNMKKIYESGANEQKRTF